MDSNQGSLKGDLVVYVLILILACVQVFFLRGHLLAMLSVAGIQAFLAISFFMHLGSEKATLRLALIPVTLFVLVMMNMIWALWSSNRSRNRGNVCVSRLSIRSRDAPKRCLLAPLFSPPTLHATRKAAPSVTRRQLAAGISSYRAYGRGFWS
jgi:heme/copper-type cytochrome/quinol oxidase subunit 4